MILFIMNFKTSTKHSLFLMLFKVSYLFNILFAKKKESIGVG